MEQMIQIRVQVWTKRNLDQWQPNLLEPNIQNKIGTLQMQWWSHWTQIAKDTGSVLTNTTQDTSTEQTAEVPDVDLTVNKDGYSGTPRSVATAEPNESSKATPEGDSKSTDKNQSSLTPGKTTIWW